jgi:hypothetical protein
MKSFTNRVAKLLAPIALLCALALPLGQTPAYAQFPVGPICVPGFGCVLVVPTALEPQILALNSQANVNHIGTMQIGVNNFALIAVQQGNLMVPTNAVGTLVNLNLQANINVINTVQIGGQNVAIISVGQGNAHL